MQLTEVVPFLVEDVLKASGGRFTRGEDWASHVAVAGRLVTGQNPQSAKATAQKIAQLLQSPARDAAAASAARERRPA